MTRLGYQIPNFTYSGIDASKLFQNVAAQAAAADANGFDTVCVMDHFYQLPMLGPPENFMLECYTTLAALAQHTKTARLSALVTGNTYRNPTLLAKTVTSLDIVSGGRAQLGIGAGWFELEHNALGFEFGAFKDRFEKLEEALQIIVPMLSDERPSLTGKHYRVSEAINQPAPISKIPIMIGGSGEKKTLRMVAQYATDSNMTAPPAEIPRKLEALATHCQNLGRPRDEISVTMQRQIVIAETTAEAEAARDSFLAERGLIWSDLDADTKAMLSALLVIGDADTVGEQMAGFLALGIDGFTCALPANGHQIGPVELLGKTLRKLLP